MYDIIVDIDGTIADNSHRLEHLRKSPKDWDAYKAGILDDDTHDDILFIIKSMWTNGCRIVHCTGRDEHERDDIVYWLTKIGFVYWEKLYMRPADDHRDDTVIKTELLEQIRNDGYNPKMAFEDRQRVVDMWRSLGIRCLQVQPGDF